MDVCILTAGIGTRLGEAGQWLNKGLLPLRQKAALTHLIERFPDGTRFVVAVGHLAAQVEGYLKLAHPGARIELVRVDPFEGPGSGPGTSVLCCERLLSGPFFLACSDTYWPPDGSFAVEPGSNIAWMGDVRADERHEYCNVALEGGRVTAIHDKTHAAGGSSAWVGLAYIRQPRLFFDGLRGVLGAPGERQISAGLTPLVEAGTLMAMPLPGWKDLGTAARYERARSELDERRFSKEGEFFYRVGDRALKFFSDPEIVRNRIERARLRPDLFPEILGHGSSFYSYRWVEGGTLYDNADLGTLGECLAWLSEEVWRRPKRVPADFRDQCMAFYRARTFARVARAERGLPPDERGPGLVDGIGVAGAEELLEAVPWSVLGDGVASFIHGDLQLDNVVAPSRPGQGRFRLIDWRQDFAGALEHGDLHYDFAKLLASIELDFRAVGRGEFRVEAGKGGLSLVAPATPGWRRLRSLVEEAAVRREGLDLAKLRLIVGLIYLNMAGVHSGDESRMLYHLGRRRLQRALSDGQRRVRPTTMAFWRGRS